MAALTHAIIAIIACIVISATVHATGIDLTCPEKFQEGREIEIKCRINLSEENCTKLKKPVFDLKLTSGDVSPESIICNQTSNLGVCRCIKVQEIILDCNLVLPDNRTKYEGAEVTFKYYEPLQCPEAKKICNITYEASSGADGQTSGRVFQVIIILIALSQRWLFC